MASDRPHRDVLDRNRAAPRRGHAQATLHEADQALYRAKHWGATAARPPKPHGIDGTARSVVVICPCCCSAFVGFGGATALVSSSWSSVRAWLGALGFVVLADVASVPFVGCSVVTVDVGAVEVDSGADGSVVLGAPDVVLSACDVVVFTPAEVVETLGVVDVVVVISTVVPVSVSVMTSGSCRATALITTGAASAATGSAASADALATTLAAMAVVVSVH